MKPPCIEQVFSELDWLSGDWAADVEGARSPVPPGATPMSRFQSRDA